MLSYLILVLLISDTQAVILFLLDPLKYVSLFINQHMWICEYTFFQLQCRVNFFFTHQSAKRKNGKSFVVLNLFS